MPPLRALGPEVSLIRGPFRAGILSGTRNPYVIDAIAHSIPASSRHAAERMIFASNGDNTPIRDNSANGVRPRHPRPPRGKRALRLVPPLVARPLMPLMAPLVQRLATTPLLPPRVGSQGAFRSAGAVTTGAKYPIGALVPKVAVQSQLSAHSPAGAGRPPFGAVSRCCSVWDLNRLC